MKKFIKVFAVLLALVLMVTAFAACGSDKKSDTGSDSTKETEKTSETTTSEGKKKVIGISLFYRRDEYYKDLESSFIYEAEKAGYEVIIQDADADPAKQTQQLEDFVQKKVDAIALAAADPAGLVPAIEAAVAAGIPVITYDGPSESDKVITHVGFDFYQDGASVGEWVKKYINENLGGKAEVAIIDFPQSAIVCGLRAQGFRDVMETMEGVKIVAQQDGKASRTDSMSVMENILTAHPDVDVVFGINYDTCAGAAAAIEAAGRTDIIVTGGAWGEEPFTKLENNDPILKAFFVTSPAVQAADTIKALTEYWEGKEVPKDYMSESKVYDATNIKELDWKAIVARRKN
ncbi:MAG TPA: sugar ABC transporter substrate-binding protein [Clostridiaceae bacterium]|nr:sugar ABC transporter substrate-binding protein [Clostridiaceae bacterium]